MKKQKLPSTTRQTLAIHWRYTMRYPGTRLEKRNFNLGGFIEDGDEL